MQLNPREIAKAVVKNQSSSATPGQDYAIYDNSKYGIRLKYPHNWNTVENVGNISNHAIVVNLYSYGYSNISAYTQNVNLVIGRLSDDNTSLHKSNSGLVRSSSSGPMMAPGMMPAIEVPSLGAMPPDVPARPWRKPAPGMFLTTIPGLARDVAAERWRANRDGHRCRSRHPARRRRSVRWSCRRNSRRPAPGAAWREQRRRGQDDRDGSKVGSDECIGAPLVRACGRKVRSTARRRQSHRDGPEGVAGCGIPARLCHVFAMHMSNR